MNTPQLSTGSKALHWSAIRDLTVASDIAGAGASGEFSSLGAPPEQIYGSALSIPGAKTHSGYGVFTDNNNNTIVIATESRQAWGIIKGKNLLGANPYIFHLERNMGSGGAFEANAFMVAGAGERYGGYAGWIDKNDAELNSIPGLTLEPYNDFPSLLTQIENRGIRFDRPIVVLSAGEPITLSSVLSTILTVILAVAKPFASLVGIPPAAFDVIANAVTVIATHGEFSVDILADAAQLVLPAEYRQLLPQAKSIYSNLSSGNYLQAMSELGISGNILGAKDKLFKGDISALLEKSELPFADIVGKVQNLSYLDTVRSIAAANRSGSVLMNIIDEGTMTKVPVLQNLLTVTTSDTLVAALPGVSDVFERVINETNDITNADLHKAALQLSLGQPVGGDALDDLTLRSLTESANTALENGASRYVMPIVIPPAKRSVWAQTIADVLKTQVIADSITGESAEPKATVREWG